METKIYGSKKAGKKRMAESEPRMAHKNVIQKDLGKLEMGIENKMISYV